MLIMDSNIKPVLKWVGGKRELIPEIRNYYKNLDFNNYFELFCGGGSVYLDIIKTFGVDKKNNSFLNDINSDLINLYKHIKDNPEEILGYCNELEKDYYEFGYYHIRDRFNGVDREKNEVEKYEGVKRSSSLILLNRTCFNGLYRTNKKGLFNVPEGRYKNPTIINKENLFELSKVLPNSKNILSNNFFEFDFIKKKDLVYLDPPYHPLNETSSFTDYSGQFGTKEQIELRDYFMELDKKGVFVLESNSSSNFISELYKDFTIVEVMCSRNINSKSSSRGKIVEYLIIGNTLKNHLNL